MKQLLDSSVLNHRVAHEILSNAPINEVDFAKMKDIDSKLKHLP